MLAGGGVGAKGTDEGSRNLDSIPENPWYRHSVILTNPSPTDL